jgi:hypothetical protein
MLNPVPQLHTPNGTLAITLPFSLLYFFTLVEVYLYQKDERVLQCSKFFVPTIYSKHIVPLTAHLPIIIITIIIIITTTTTIKLPLGLRFVLQFLSRCHYSVEWCTIMTGELKETGKNVVVA